jgi:hypothetical protein
LLLELLEILLLYQIGADAGIVSHITGSDAGNAISLRQCSIVYVKGCPTLGGNQLLAWGFLELFHLAAEMHHYPLLANLWGLAA